VVDLGHWEGVLEENVDLPYGFIYKITNLTNDKKYIGKKQCQSIKKRPPLKGKKNKRHEKIETDWKTYTSSSNELNKDLETLGKDNFKFEILRWCDSKWELSYYEARLQFKEEVLLRNDYYNGIINVRIGGRK
tara:strand:+ start:139 stop:537 length:399 start_codon:yes stop_codon:yes gene_type:complete